MDFAINIDQGGQGVLSDQPGDDLFNNVYLSLNIPQGSWWFDPTFGLRKRTRMKNTDSTAKLLQQDIQAALKWLLDAGRATAVAVEMIRDVAADRNHIQAAVTMTAANGRMVTYRKFIGVV